MPTDPKRMAAQPYTTSSRNMNLISGWGWTWTGNTMMDV